ncbi:MAG: RpoL/Rpb11 RNA polymerase subunit family protein [Thermoplasmatota archaeon]
MEVNVVKDTKREFVFEIIADKTILNPLKQRLLVHKDVDYAGWDIQHPLLSNPTFYLRVKKGSAKELALQALQELQQDLAHLQDSLEA